MTLIHEIFNLVSCSCLLPKSNESPAIANVIYRENLSSKMSHIHGAPMAQCHMIPAPVEGPFSNPLFI